VPGAHRLAAKSADQRTGWQNAFSASGYAAFVAGEDLLGAYDTCPFGRFIEVSVVERRRLECQSVCYQLKNVSFTFYVGAAILSFQIIEVGASFYLKSPGDLRKKRTHTHTQLLKGVGSQELHIKFSLSCSQ
jgi:hypothetical protein